MKKSPIFLSKEPYQKSPPIPLKSPITRALSNEPFHSIQRALHLYAKEPHLSIKRAYSNAFYLLYSSIHLHAYIHIRIHIHSFFAYFRMFVRSFCQKSPIFQSKKPPKSPPKSPIFIISALSNELFNSIKKALNFYQKIPTNLSQEPYQTSLSIPSKELYIASKRALYCYQKSPIFLAKEPNLFITRAPYQTSPWIPSKQSYFSVNAAFLS